MKDMQNMVHIVGHLGFSKYSCVGGGIILYLCIFMFILFGGYKVQRPEQAVCA